MIVNGWGQLFSGKPKVTHFVFDVDGTLTPNRGSMDPGFQKWFLDFATANPVYLVSGSSYERIQEQVGTEVVQRVIRTYACSGNQAWELGVCVRSNQWRLPDASRDWLMAHLRYSKFVLRTGNHILDRPGSATFSVVGDNATLAERLMYTQYDRETGERERLVQGFNATFPGITAAIGGDTGIDITPIGRDKSQILEDCDRRDRLYFFGDRTTPVGNDYPLISGMRLKNRNTWYTVRDWQDTWERLSYLTEAGIAQ
jgi:phosphomannomutase